MTKGFKFHKLWAGINARKKQSDNWNEQVLLMLCRTIQRVTALLSLAFYRPAADVH